MYGVNTQSGGNAYGRAKFQYENQPIRSIAISTFKASADFDDSNYTGTSHSIILAPFSFAPTPKVALGNLVFNDLNGDGIYDPSSSEQGIDGVTVELFGQGDDPNADTPIATTTTASGGLYEFDELEEGSYFVHLPKENFQGGGDLETMVSSFGSGTDTGADDSADENGVDAADPTATGISSGTIALAADSEPTDGTS